MNRPGWAYVAVLAGILPAIAVHAAYVANRLDGGALAPEFLCNPYLDGCLSISRAARSGPGLYLFRTLMLPCAALTFVTWIFIRGRLLEWSLCGRRLTEAVGLSGMVGAVFLAVYVTWLGTDGELYYWLRRYGVVFYFGGTALAQLLLVRVLWPARDRIAHGGLSRPITLLTGLVSLQWTLGIVSVLKRILLDNPDLIDRVENIIEWWFALAMSLAFVVIAPIFRKTEPRETL